MKILLAHRGAGRHTEGPILALEYAKTFKAKIFIITSLMFGDKDHAFAYFEKGDMKQNIEHIVNKFNTEGIECETIISEHVDPGHAIVDYAKKQQIDLTIIGVRRRSKLGKLFLGSNAQYVILNSPCPVLTYKEGS